MQQCENLHQKKNVHCHDRILLTNNSLNIVFINIVTKLNLTFNLLSFKLKELTIILIDNSHAYEEILKIKEARARL